MVGPRLLIVALALLGATEARAASDEAVVDALVEEARADFEAQRFEEAAEKLKQAHRKRPSPYLLHNIARCYQEARDYDRALDYFLLYLRTSPSERRAGKAWGHIEDLDAALMELERLKAKREKRARRPEFAERLPRKEALEGGLTRWAPSSEAEPPVAGWVLVGSGAAATIGGAVLVGLGFSDKAAVEDAEREAGVVVGVTRQEALDRADDATLKSGLGWGLVGAGLALGIAGAVLVATSDSEPPTGVVEVGGVGLSVGPGGVALVGGF